MLKKMILHICMLYALSLLHFGCNQHYKYTDHPTNLGAAIWSTEDGSVTFTINETWDYNTHGTLQINGETKEIGFHFDLQFSEAYLYFLDDAQEENGIEQAPYFVTALSDPASEDKFVLRITEANAYFEAGERLVFYKTEIRKPLYKPNAS